MYLHATRRWQWMLPAVFLALLLIAPPHAFAACADAADEPYGVPHLEVVYSAPAYLSLPGGTTVNPESFYSPALDREMRYEVILPPNYYASGQSYPVLYFLHGYGGWSHSWIELGLHQTADYLWSAGYLEPFIIVLPDGENSYFLNHAWGGERWADYLVEDLLSHIDTTYRSLPDAAYRAIGGLSMGGDGALQVALNHSDSFRVAGAHSPTTRLDYDQAPWPLYGDESYWQQHNPLWLIQNTKRAAHLTLWIDMGQDDGWLPNARALHDALTEQGLPHQYHEYPGDHGGDYWIANEAAYLRFYAQAFYAGWPFPDTTPADDLEPQPLFVCGELQDGGEF